jgi:PEGA domain
MGIDLSGRHIVLVCLFIGLLAAGHASAEARNGTIGDIIPFSGTAPAADMIYLFMTGPGVPPNGSRMDSSISPVMTGEPDTFTQIPVEGGRWSYSWQTGRISGGLDPGHYTVYAATAPVAKDALSGIPYSSTEVFLTRPVTTGTILVRSAPPGAQVEVNGRYSGNTPIDLPDLSPGMYQVNISFRDYVPYKERVNLSAGETEQISVKLDPRSPLTTPPTLPLTISQDARETTDMVAPTSAPLPGVVVVSGIFTGLAVAIWFFRR